MMRMDDLGAITNIHDMDVRVIILIYQKAS